MNQTDSQSAFGVPVLAYHANNVSTNDYTGNDHIALAIDLRALADAGWSPVSLETVVAWQSGALDDDAVRHRYAITFDDGSDFDYRDIEHPTCGTQRSLVNVLGDFEQERQVATVASSFVIASPLARQTLDERGLAGRGWWNDDWWAKANGSGRLMIESHGWDHLHPLLDEVAQAEGRSGDFRAIDNLEDCRRQLRDSAQYISERAERRPRFFAFPWGQYSDYLVSEYLPQEQGEHGYLAAFGTVAAPVRRSNDRWRLPRLVCGDAWRSPETLVERVRDSQSA